MPDSQWTRYGSCSDCGWCCENLGRFAINVSSPDKHYLEVRGAKSTPLGLVIEGDFHAPCQYHVDNKCGIYNDRPSTCVDFPSDPNEITHTSCTYSFERSVDGTVEQLGGRGSPFPL